MSLGRLFCLPLLVVLSACASFKPGPVPSVVHSSYPAVAPQSVEFDLQLTVAEPQLLALWQDNRVLLRTAEGELGALQGVVWADQTGALLQTSLIEAMQSRSGLRAISRAGDGSRNDWLLLSAVPRFELDYRQSPGQAALRWDLRLLEVASGRVLARTTLDAEQALPTAGEVGSAERSRAHAMALLDLLHAQAGRAADWLRAQAGQRQAPVQDGFEG